MVSTRLLLSTTTFSRPHLGKTNSRGGPVHGENKANRQTDGLKMKKCYKATKTLRHFLEMKNWDEKWRNGAGKKAKTDRKSYYPISVDCWLSCAKTLPCFYLTSCLPSLDLFCLSLSPSSEKRTFISYWHNLSFFYCRISTTINTFSLSSLIWLKFYPRLLFSLALNRVPSSLRLVHRYSIQ